MFWKCTEIHGSQTNYDIINIMCIIWKKGGTNFVFWLSIGDEVSTHSRESLLNKTHDDYRRMGARGRVGVWHRVEKRQLPIKFEINRTERTGHSIFYSIIYIWGELAWSRLQTRASFRVVTFESTQPTTLETTPSGTAGELSPDKTLSIENSPAG